MPRGDGLRKRFGLGGGKSRQGGAPTDNQEHIPSAPAGSLVNLHAGADDAPHNDTSVVVYGSMAEVMAHATENTDDAADAAAEAPAREPVTQASLVAATQKAQRQQAEDDGAPATAATDDATDTPPPRPPKSVSGAGAGDAGGDVATTAAAAEEAAPTPAAVPQSPVEARWNETAEARQQIGALGTTSGAAPTYDASFAAAVANPIREAHSGVLNTFSPKEQDEDVTVHGVIGKGAQRTFAAYGSLDNVGGKSNRDRPLSLGQVQKDTFEALAAAVQTHASGATAVNVLFSMSHDGRLTFNTATLGAGVRASVLKGELAPTAVAGGLGSDAAGTSGKAPAQDMTAMRLSTRHDPHSEQDMLRGKTEGLSIIPGGRDATGSTLTKGNRITGTDGSSIFTSRAAGLQGYTTLGLPSEAECGAETSIKIDDLGKDDVLTIRLMVDAGDTPLTEARQLQIAEQAAAQYGANSAVTVAAVGYTVDASMPGADTAVAKPSAERLVLDLQFTETQLQAMKAHPRQVYYAFASTGVGKLVAGEKDTAEELVGWFPGTLNATMSACEDLTSKKGDINIDTHFVGLVNGVPLEDVIKAVVAGDDTDDDDEEFGEVADVMNRSKTDGAHRAQRDPRALAHHGRSSFARAGFDQAGRRLHHTDTARGGLQHRVDVGGGTWRPALVPTGARRGFEALPSAHGLTRSPTISPADSAAALVPDQMNADFNLDLDTNAANLVARVLMCVEWYEESDLLNDLVGQMQVPSEGSADGYKFAVERDGDGEPQKNETHGRVDEWRALEKAALKFYEQGTVSGFTKEGIEAFENEVFDVIAKIRKGITSLGPNSRFAWTLERILGDETHDEKTADSVRRRPKCRGASEKLKQKAAEETQMSAGLPIDFGDSPIPKDDADYFIARHMVARAKLFFDEYGEEVSSRVLRPSREKDKLQQNIREQLEGMLEDNATLDSWYAFVAPDRVVSTGEVVTAVVREQMTQGYDKKIHGKGKFSEVMSDFVDYFEAIRPVGVVGVLRQIKAVQASRPGMSAGGADTGGAVAMGLFSLATDSDALADRLGPAPQPPVDTAGSSDSDDEDDPVIRQGGATMPTLIRSGGV
jgi:hypothetical protein